MVFYWFAVFVWKHDLIFAHVFVRSFIRSFIHSFIRSSRRFGAKRQPMNRWTIRWTNKRMNDWTNERANELTKWQGYIIVFFNERTKYVAKNKVCVVATGFVRSFIRSFVHPDDPGHKAPTDEHMN